MSEVIKVGMADLNTCVAPDRLTTLGLGSCIGICLYDKSKKIAGMAHIMLPSSEAVKNNSNKAKFADTAIDALIEKMESLGVTNKRSLVCKIAGGAQMFAFQSGNETMQVGKRNADAVREKMKQLGIKILADETGGNFGRTIEFSAETGILSIKTIGHGTKEL
ncbi:MAG: chemotaxis protein CheD [Bacillota bacterium]|nr:chemotaxis protein CheD [Bacillota bacterium]